MFSLRKVCTLLPFFFFATQNVYIMAGALAAILGHPALEWQCRELGACIPVDEQSAIHVYTIALWDLFGGRINPS